MSSRRAFQRVFSPAKTCLACLAFFLAGFSADPQEKGRGTAWMSDATFIFRGMPIKVVRCVSGYHMRHNTTRRWL